MEKSGSGGSRNTSKSTAYAPMVISLELCCTEIGIFRSYVSRDTDWLLSKSTFSRCKRENLHVLKKYLAEACSFNKIKNK